MDEWLLYEMRSTRASGARGLTFGKIFSQDGQLLASVAQEGLIRDRAMKPD
jgi:acyl-CoA thioesterase II